MNRQLKLLPRAIDDARTARGWYEDQREGLGIEFQETLEAALIAIARFPELYPQVVNSVRRCLVGHFPYGIFYEIQSDDSIVVISIFHASRDPKVWPA